MAESLMTGSTVILVFYYMANGLTFEIVNLNMILLIFYCQDFNKKKPLQNFKEIDSKLTEKLPKIMQSWLIIFNFYGEYSLPV